MSDLTVKPHAPASAVARAVEGFHRIRRGRARSVAPVTSTTRRDRRAVQAAAIDAGPSTVAPFAIALAYGGGLWEHLLHEAAGATERTDLPGVLHWLRDASLSLPLVWIAVWIGLLLARRLLASAGATASSATALAVVPVVVALYTCAVVGAASPFHGLLFGAEHPVYDGQAQSLVAHMVDDGLLAVVANLPIATAVYALLRYRARRLPRRDGQQARPRRVYALLRHRF